MGGAGGTPWWSAGSGLAGGAAVDGGETYEREAGWEADSGVAVGGAFNSAAGVSGTRTCDGGCPVNAIGSCDKSPATNTTTTAARSVYTADKG